jgi:hypothetical protein
MKVISKNPYANGKNAIAMYDLIKDVGQFIIDKPFTNIAFNTDELMISPNTILFKLRGAITYYKQFFPHITSDNIELTQHITNDFKIFVAKVTSLMRIDQDGRQAYLKYKQTVTNQIPINKVEFVTLVDVGNCYRFSEYFNKYPARNLSSIPKLPTLREFIYLGKMENREELLAAEETQQPSTIIDIPSWYKQVKEGKKPADFVTDSLDTLSDNLLQELGQLNAEGVIKFESNEDGSIVFKAL